jgi:hypothetical protein
MLGTCWILEFLESGDVLEGTVVILVCNIPIYSIGCISDVESCAPAAVE